MLYPEDAVVLSGDTVVFKCVGYGDPIPFVTWNTSGIALRNGSQIHTKVYNKQVMQGLTTFVQSTLEICSTEVADTNTYSCTADSGLDFDTVYFEMIVLERRKSCTSDTIMSVS